MTDTYELRTSQYDHPDAPRGQHTNGPSKKIDSKLEPGILPISGSAVPFTSRSLTMTSPAMPSLPGTRMTWQEYLETYDPEVYWFYTPCGTYCEQKNEDMFWSLRHTDNCDGVMDDETLDWSSLDGRWGIKGYLKEEYT